MKKTKYRFDYDRDGIKYQHPERSCKWCKCYPCMELSEKVDVDFAKYGCEEYEEL